MTVKWSQAYADFISKDRYFDNIIANSKATEEREQKRLVDVEALLHQRKRGTRDTTSADQSEIKQQVAVRQQNQSVQPISKTKDSSKNLSRVNEMTVSNSILKFDRFLKSMNLQVQLICVSHYLHV